MTTATITNNTNQNGLRSPAQCQATPTPRAKFKFARAASPRKWLLGQKAVAAMRAEELRGVFLPDIPAQSGRWESESECGLQLELRRLDDETSDIGFAVADSRPPPSLSLSPVTRPGPLPAGCLRGHGEGDLDVVDIGRPPRAATSQLLMTAEAGTAMAFPVRRRPSGVTIPPVLFLLGLVCVVGLVQCLLRAFAPSSETLV